MYAGTRGYWVYRSTDNGESWQLINSGMGEDKYVLSLLTNSSGYLFAGLDYNGLYKSVNPVVTSIVGELNQKIEYELTQNYPNPFNPSTKIRYSIPSNVKGKTSNVILKVYDVLGNKVATLVDEYKTAGSYEVDFDAAGLSSGVYFYKFTSGSYSLTKKMVLMR
ncbi:MAG: T9SS type A sorting domain-containing protein [Ignavibacteriaceae bacterium]|nr:T9SS type A sorting domain-containing protein [Ignavibacteriaceae bacterium]